MTSKRVRRGHRENMRWRRVGAVEVVERSWRDPLTPTLHDISNDEIAEAQGQPLDVNLDQDCILTKHWI
jgi:hypothetical protein